MHISESQGKPIRKAGNEQFHRPVSMVTAMTSCSRLMNGSSARPHGQHQNWSANVTPFSLKDKDCGMNEEQITKDGNLLPQKSSQALLRPTIQRGKSKTFMNDE